MKKSNIIAIAGFKNSGKDTSAEMLRYLLNSPKFFHKYFWFKYLKNFFKSDYKIVSFAFPLKKTLAALLNIDYVLLNSRAYKETLYVKFPELIISSSPISTLSDSKLDKFLNSNNFSFLQSYYLSIRQVLQVFGTEIMRNYFGDSLWINATLKNCKSSHVIISDLRFKTEYEAIKRLNALTIYINNPKAKQGFHASERELVELLNQNKFDIIINNDGSLKDLFYKLKILI